ncbi:MAG: YbjN domain-containing protein [Catalinimonas sp.]
MPDYFDKVRSYLLELEYDIVQEDADGDVLIVEKPDEGIVNLLIGCADPLLIMEQVLLDLPAEQPEVLRSLLMKNREIVHGAFALDDSGRLLFRDTLQLENLDLNELEASLNSLSLLLSEYADELIRFSKL